jgi:histone deacetylase complex regulatory component SIN3
MASYVMWDPTEGVDLSQLRSPCLRRRLPHSKGSVEDAYVAVYGTLESDDAQAVSISPETYKMYYEGGLSFYREVSGREKKHENDHFEDKLVKNPTWVGEESEEAVNRRTAAWTKALKEDLSGYEAALAKPVTDVAPTGDVTMSEETA